MTSLILGLLAALCWGLHDFFVRDLSQKAPPIPLLAGVLAFGSVLLAPLALMQGMGGMQGEVLAQAAGAGAAYVLASYGLYRAFAIGPVGLVAPICGAYPLGSMALALTSGQTVSALAWLAVLMVVVGIALVARQADHSKTNRNSDDEKQVKPPRFVKRRRDFNGNDIVVRRMPFDTAHFKPVAAAFKIVELYMSRI